MELEDPAHRHDDVCGMPGVLARRLSDHETRRSREARHPEGQRDQGSADHQAGSDQVRERARGGCGGRSVTVGERDRRGCQSAERTRNSGEGSQGTRDPSVTGVRRMIIG